MTDLAKAPYGDRFVVNRVGDSTPASEAGLEVGDILDSLDGAPVRDLAYDEVNRLLRQGTGRTLEICVLRERDVICVNLVVWRRI